MINGAHSIIYSKQPEADRDFLRDGRPEAMAVTKKSPPRRAVEPKPKANAAARKSGKG